MEGRRSDAPEKLSILVFARRVPSGSCTLSVADEVLRLLLLCGSLGCVEGSVRLVSIRSSSFSPYKTALQSCCKRRVSLRREGFAGRRYSSEAAARAEAFNESGCCPATGKRRARLTRALEVSSRCNSLIDHLEHPLPVKKSLQQQLINGVRRGALRRRLPGSEQLTSGGVLRGLLVLGWR